MSYNTSNEGWILVDENSRRRSDITFFDEEDLLENASHAFRGIDASIFEMNRNLQDGVDISFDLRNIFEDARDISLWSLLAGYVDNAQVWAGLAAGAGIDHAKSLAENRGREWHRFFFHLEQTIYSAIISRHEGIQRHVAEYVQSLPDSYREDVGSDRGYYGIKRDAALLLDDEGTARHYHEQLQEHLSSDLTKRAWHANNGILDRNAPLTADALQSILEYHALKADDDPFKSDKVTNPMVLSLWILARERDIPVTIESRYVPTTIDPLLPPISEEPVVARPADVETGLPMIEETPEIADTDPGKLIARSSQPADSGRGIDHVAYDDEENCWTVFEVATWDQPGDIPPEILAVTPDGPRLSHTWLRRQAADYVEATLIPTSDLGGQLQKGLVADSLVKRLVVGHNVVDGGTIDSSFTEPDIELDTADVVKLGDSE